MYLIMMKKILLLTENLGSGGAERQLCGLASMLTKAGFTCRLITYVENQFYEPYLRRNGVDYEFVPKLFDKKTRILMAVKYVRLYSPDVVISFLSSMNKTMCLAKLAFKAKLIVSERNNNTCITRSDKIRFNLYRMADAIVPNSNSQGKFICNNFPFLIRRCTRLSILWMSIASRHQGLPQRIKLFVLLLLLAMPRKRMC